MKSEFRMKHRVEFAHTDLAGIMHFSNYFRFMEETEHAFLRSLGTSVFTVFEGQEVGWPRVRTACDFRHPLRFEEEFWIRLIVRRIGGSSVDYVHVFERRSGGKIQVAAVGEMTAVCVVKGTGGFKAHPVPAGLRDRIKAAPPERYERLLAPRRPGAEEMVGFRGREGRR